MWINVLCHIKPFPNLRNKSREPLACTPTVEMTSPQRPIHVNSTIGFQTSKERGSLSTYNKLPPLLVTYVSGQTGLYVSCLGQIAMEFSKTHAIFRRAIFQSVCPHRGKVMLKCVILFSFNSGNAFRKHFKRCLIFTIIKNVTCKIATVLVMSLWAEHIDICRLKWPRLNKSMEINVVGLIGKGG